MGVRVPNFVPDGAQPGLPVAAGWRRRPRLGNPTWAPRSLLWRPPASRGRPWASGWAVVLRPPSSRWRVGVDNDPPSGLNDRDHVMNW